MADIQRGEEAFCMSEHAQPEAMAHGSEEMTLQSTRLVRLREIIARVAIYIVLAILFVVSALVSPHFLKPRNIANLLKQASSLGVATVGQTFVILTGGIDLSVAAVMALMSVLAANLMQGQDNLVPSITVLCLAVAMAVGLVNGLLVTKLKIPAFIATLGTILIVQGIRFVYTGGAPKGSIPDALRFWGRGSIGPVIVAETQMPAAVVVWAVIVVLAAIVLSRTTFGRRLYAVGGNPATAHLSGVNVDNTIIAAYTVCSFLAGVAGLMLTGYIGFADNWLGRGYDLDSIAAVVVGGTVLEGGRGTVLGSVAGVFIVVILYNLVLLLGLDEETQRIVKGIAIIVAVALYMRLRARQE
jgi:ribose transport system permease protein/inositol transport system permease protein